MKSSSAVAIALVAVLAFGLGEASKVEKRQEGYCCYLKRFVKERKTTKIFSDGRAEENEEDMVCDVITANEQFFMGKAPSLGRFSQQEEWRTREDENFITYVRGDPESCWTTTVTTPWRNLSDGVNDRECLGGFAIPAGKGIGPDGNEYEMWKHTKNNNYTLYTEVGSGPGIGLCKPAFVTGYSSSYFNDYDTASFVAYDFLSDDEIEQVLDRARKFPICKSSYDDYFDA